MKQKTQLDPKLKDWVDRVVVPALVKEYLIKKPEQKKIEAGAEHEVESPAKSMATAERER